MSDTAFDKKKRPVIFLIVGAGNTLLDFSFYSLLTAIVFTRPNQIALAGVISGTFALTCAFTTHAFITFRGHQVSKMTIVRFGIFTGFGMWVIRPLLLTIFIRLQGLYNWAYSVTQKLHLPFHRSFVAHTGAFILMTILVLVYNYYVYSRYVFKTYPRTDLENH